MPAIDSTHLIHRATNNPNPTILLPRKGGSGGGGRGGSYSGGGVGGSGGSGLSTGAIIGVVVGTIVAVLLIYLLVWYFKKQASERNRREDEEHNRKLVGGVEDMDHLGDERYPRH